MSSVRLATSILAFAALGLGAAGCLEDRPTELGSAAEDLTSTSTIQRGTYGTVADTFIAANEMRKNFGGQKKLRVSKKNEALLRFDLSSIPANAVINKAELTLFVNGGDDEDDDDCDDGDHEGRPIAPLKVHRITAAWAEGTVTYRSFSQAFDPAVAGTIVLSNRNSYKTLDLKPLVQSWVNGSAPNFGVIINTAGKAHTLIVSSEQPQRSQRPALKITYTTPDDHCDPNQCQHGGTCVNNNTGYTCQCAPGYEGDNCQTSVDDCAPNPCLNGGACTDGLGSYSCACAPGYSGVNCQTNINDCAGGPCLNGGVCTDAVNDYTCACAPGYSGDDCQTNIDDCAGAPCQNGGACADGVDGYACTCALGFSGATCAINIDDCAGNPCLNGGTCADGVDSYSCACAPGYTDSTCSTNIDECASDPCLNGGSCTDGANGYTCGCAAGYTGANCELDINDCALDPCQHGGQCVDLVNTYACTCPAGYGGTNCETDIDDCAGDPCGANGTCTDGVDSHTCVCDGFYSGADCEIAPCGNGLVQGAEQCDDGNIVNGDGCSSTCTLECPTASAPSHQWTFNDGTANDSVGGATGTLFGTAHITGGALVLDNAATAPNQHDVGQYMKAALPDSVSTKTLVVWTTLADLSQHGGSALTIDDRGAGDNNHFDAIDYAEQFAGQWMNGSDNFNRTRIGSFGAAETSTDRVMVAIAYGADGSIAIYRNGVPYSAPYVKGTLRTYPGGASDALIGLRHSVCTVGPCWLSGSIDEARIYPTALTACQIQALQPVPQPAPSCPAGSTLAGGKCYKFVAALASQPDALAACRLLPGGDLASAHSTEENRFLGTIIDPNGDGNGVGGLTAWIGGTSPHGFNCPAEAQHGAAGIFTWTDGSAWNYNAWRTVTNEPDACPGVPVCTQLFPDNDFFHNNICGFGQTANGQSGCSGWNDVPCSFAMGYICQFNPN